MVPTRPKLKSHVISSSTNYFDPPVLTHAFLLQALLFEDVGVGIVLTIQLLDAIASLTWMDGLDRGDQDIGADPTGQDTNAHHPPREQFASSTCLPVVSRHVGRPTAKLAS
jgi:hypothetical protein